MPNARGSILRFGIRIIFFLILTVLTQVGGIIYLCLLPFFNFIKSKNLKSYYTIPAKVLSFIITYSIICLIIVPPIAKQLGRVPLPLNSNTLKPATTFTYICNRHYVKPQLKKLLINSANQLSEKYKGAVTYYLDANFPFINKFPLFPHLSHNDGKKVDIAFFYTRQNTSEQKHGSPSPIGYGAGIKPKSKEINSAVYCTKQGFWQYNIMDRLIAPFKKRGYSFDDEKTGYLINSFIKARNTEKVFIEPFLVKRLKLYSPKLRFHGCHAVSHADHIHLQIN